MTACEDAHALASIASMPLLVCFHPIIMLFVELEGPPASEAPNALCVDLGDPI